jgi:hypothetical protein
MKQEWKKSIARVIGNFGMSFFIPLMGSSFAQSYFSNRVDFYESISVGVISASVVTGLAISKELLKYGSKRS